MGTNRLLSTSRKHQSELRRKYRVLANRDTQRKRRFSLQKNSVLNWEFNHWNLAPKALDKFRKS
jgi:hypothetical protein